MAKGPCVSPVRNAIINMNFSRAHNNRKFNFSAVSSVVEIRIPFHILFPTDHATLVFNFAGGVNSLFLGVGCGIGTALCGFFIDAIGAVDAFRLFAVGTLVLLVFFAASQAVYFCFQSNKDGKRKLLEFCFDRLTRKNKREELDSMPAQNRLLPTPSPSVEKKGLVDGDN